MKTKFFPILMLLGLAMSQNIMGQKEYIGKRGDKQKVTAEELNKKANDCFNGLNGEFMNKEKAVGYWKESAGLGDAHAQWILVYNNFVEGEEAMNLLRSSAEQKYPPAMNLMSRCYYDKGGYSWFPEKDLRQSDYWARLSAETGDAEGQFLYGSHFYFEDWGAKDMEKALEWWTLSANQNYLAALGAIAKAYELGVFASDNKDEMYHWLLKAAETGDAYSQYKYADALLNRKDIEEDESFRQAFPWVKKAAEQDFVEAYSDMCMYYMFGFGDIPIDASTALKWARKGAAVRDVVCCWLVSEIGRMFGSEVNVSLEEQIRSLEIAAEQGYFNAQAQLGLYHFTGVAPNADSQKGLPVIINLAESGKSPRAMSIYGFLLYNGMGVRKDIRLGAEYIRRAIRMGDDMNFDFAKENKII